MDVDKEENPIPPDDFTGKIIDVKLIKSYNNKYYNRFCKRLCSIKRIVMLRNKMQTKTKTGNINNGYNTN